MDSGTTSIDSLPLSPQTDHNNIQFQPNGQQQYQPGYQQQGQQPGQQPGGQLSQSTFDKNGVKQLMDGLKTAGSSGMTGLSIRDVPQNQTHHITDQAVYPNYIPQNEINEQTGQRDYIFQHQTSEDVIRENARKQQKADSLDIFYNEMQIPILIAVLYFLFQLPVVNKTLFTYMPSLFNNEGNHNLGGYLFNSIMFGGIYFLMTKIIQNFTI
jgi:hypothetical protein